MADTAASDLQCTKRDARSLRSKSEQVLADWWTAGSGAWHPSVDGAPAGLFAMWREHAYCTTRHRQVADNVTANKAPGHEIIEADPRQLSVVGARRLVR